MGSNESSEMYLETIFLLEKDKGHAHGVEIAKKLSVSKASVTKAMRNLKTEGYICKESYGSITLTDKGRAVSEKIYSKHQIITLFLKHSLGVTESDAAANACRMEHVLTENLLEAITDYLDRNDIDRKRKQAGDDYV